MNTISHNQNNLQLGGYLFQPDFYHDWGLFLLFLTDVVHLSPALAGIATLPGRA